MTFTVTTPATDRSLLTLAELKTAAGVSDSSKDASLTTLGNRVAALIARACNLRTGGAVPPTLRLETITETFRPNGYTEVLILSRSPVVSIASVTEVGTLLGVDDFQNSDGALERLSGGEPSCWAAGSVPVVYTAGWETVPDDLKMAAVKFVQAEWQQGDRDPLLMSKSIEGVSEYRWWVDPTKDSVVPADVMSILKEGGYIKMWI